MRCSHRGRLRCDPLVVRDVGFAFSSMQRSGADVGMMLHAHVEVDSMHEKSFHMVLWEIMSRRVPGLQLREKTLQGDKHVLSCAYVRSQFLTQFWWTSCWLQARTLSVLLVFAMSGWKWQSGWANKDWQSRHGSAWQAGEKWSSQGWSSSTSWKSDKNSGWQDSNSKWEESKQRGEEGTGERSWILLVG